MRVLAKVSPKWRDRFDSLDFWQWVSFCAITGLFLWLFFVSQTTSRTLANQAKSDAVRIAETRLAAESAYRRCIESIPPLTKFSTHVAGVNDLAQTLLRNSEETLRLTPLGDPLYRQRVENLSRLEKAAMRVAAFGAFPVPTKKECDQRRREALRGVG